VTARPHADGEADASGSGAHGARLCIDGTRTRTTAHDQVLSIVLEARRASTATRSIDASTMHIDP
jgi:hypothetical protein